ncbi:ubiquinol-cytochrome-c reductase complex assembly factor 1 [Dendroctonus ponderosae]|uniref:Ubiquinol-cytochrome c chaperone domain-containing protein n=1 Tax=Dendroctonus ponderosae TaxID=77166 RepID=U4ULY0_DENPD|nr:ubiquinol-cytochrome-c reductase complex assembly factor 1 [Dendroctonus ponderosae]ERL91181.1 hypothetical protein D910_08520 [Dendroctonus ponderosae]KAH1028906.1 hypothetical protein HUJ05_002225 [Dendroctonus ponderosae]
MNFPRLRAIRHQARVIANIYNSRGLKSCKNTLKPQLGASQRVASTVEVKPEQTDGFLRKMLNKLPFMNIERIRAQSSAYLLYENVVDKLDYVELFERYELPDTFFSWFAITELHVWMLCARAMAEGDLGQLIRNSIVEALWVDVARRTKQLGDVNPAALRAQVEELSHQLQATFIAYDEGIQSDDIVLAGAIWRRLYQMQYASPHHVEDFVRYVRQHMAQLDRLTKEQLLAVRPVKWELIDKM